MLSSFSDVIMRIHYSEWPPRSLHSVFDLSNIVRRVKLYYPLKSYPYSLQSLSKILNNIASWKTKLRRQISEMKGNSKTGDFPARSIVQLIKDLELAIHLPSSLGNKSSCHVIAQQVNYNNQRFVFLHVYSLTNSQLGNELHIYQIHSESTCFMVMCALLLD